MMQYAVYIIIGIAVLTLACAAGLYLSVRRIPVEDAEMRRISGFIREGAMAYLKRQYRVLIIFSVVVVILLSVIPSLGWKTAVAFLVGAVFSALAGFFGMRAATLANARTAQAAKRGIAPALSVAFSGGSVLGLCVVGLGSLGIAITYLIFKDLSIATGFSFGASSIALFCRVGGGIYTKAADVGADLVGKVEAGIPEDDPRNPAVIADNVGDNVGDVAGMGADLFESYVGAILSALLLGLSAFGKISNPDNAIFFVLLLVGVGLISSIIGIFVTRSGKGTNVQRQLNTGTYTAIVLMLIGTALLTHFGLGPIASEITSVVGKNPWMLFVAIAAGVIAGALIGKLSEVYTSADYRYVKHIARQSQTGPATNILAGLSTGMESTALPILVICVAVYVAFVSFGLFGVALAAVGMLSTIGMIVAVDAYGPVSDNAGGIAEMSGAPEEIREITDKLDSVGNTTAAIGKGFSIGSAALTALALMVSYTQAVGMEAVDLLRPAVLVGLFIGGMLTFLFGALTMSAVSNSAQAMIDEVRRQFHAIPGIMEGKATPDYSRCVDISTRAALRQMIIPGILAIACPVAIGLLLGKEALGGLLAGATVTGVLMAIFMANAGGAWDNAKKYIESGAEGGKGSEPHKAAVIGDTVGDPMKDTSGPSMNILIKLMSIVALVLAPLLNAISPLIGG
jgi:K(+)-stimulated pyrophosphate-energized sodium pump